MSLIRSANSFANGNDTEALGTGSVNLTAIIPVPSSADGVQLVVATTALTNNTATSWLYGLSMFDSAGNNIYDLANTTAAQRIAVNWTGFTAPFGGSVTIHPETGTNLVLGGGATNYALTVIGVPLPFSIRVQRIVAGGTLTAITTTWAVYGLYPR